MAEFSYTDRCRCLYSNYKPSTIYQDYILVYARPYSNKRLRVNLNIRCSHKVVLLKALENLDVLDLFPKVEHQYAATFCTTGVDFKKLIAKQNLRASVHLLFWCRSNVSQEVSLSKGKIMEVIFSSKKWGKGVFLDPFTRSPWWDQGIRL